MWSARTNSMVKSKENSRNTRDQEYHDKNIDLCRSILHEYATTNMSWENLFRMYGIPNNKFHRWIKKYGLQEELSNAKRRAKSSHLTKVKRVINDRIIQDIKEICDTYANKPVTWKQACAAHGVNHNTFRDNCRRYNDIVGHVLEEAKIEHERNKVSRIQEQADYAVEKAMTALVDKLDRRVVKEKHRKVTEQKVGRRKVKSEVVTDKVKEIEPDMTAIQTVLKLAGLLNENQQIIVQNQIDVIGQKSPRELEFDTKSDYERLQELGVDYVDFEEELT
jgi:uncharacterized NAD(P)/FAD-binding protein YdhS